MKGNVIRKDVGCMEIKYHTAEKLNDPTGILVGDRYEYILNIEVDEEDELYSEHGLGVKLILAVDENGSRIAQYQLYEQVTNKFLDFGLEEDEEEMLKEYCMEHLPE